MTRRLPYSFTTYDGREIDTSEALDAVPARGHVPGECIEDCWTCATNAAVAAEFGGAA